MDPEDPLPETLLPSRGLAPAGASDERAGGETPRLLEPGDIVGRYRIRKCIGEGGVGVVYAAEDPELDRVVAIKVLRPAEGREAEAQQRRMLREAQALAKVSHRNLVMVFDVGMHRGRIWIAMEYVVGDTLDQWLESERRTWGEIVEVFISAGRGLAAVHAAGLVHRDFKPSNVLVRPDGTVQVLDFGLAARVGEQIEVSEHEERPSLALAAHDALVATMTKSVMGTPAYMAPEQFLLQPTDGRTDQFGFCVALYEALYGHRPFKGEDVPELMHAIVEGLPGLPPELPGLPEAVRRAIARGLAVKQEDRFADMNALLHELASTRTFTVRGSGGWMRFALGMLVGGGVLAGVALWWAQAPDVTPPAAVTPPSPPPEETPAPANVQPAEPVQRELPTLAPPEDAEAVEPDPVREMPAPRVGRERSEGSLPRMREPASGAAKTTKPLPSLTDPEESEQPPGDDRDRSKPRPKPASDPPDPKPDAAEKPSSEPASDKPSEAPVPPS